MSVLITSPKCKENLVKEFEKYTEVVSQLDSSVRLIIPTVDEELPFFAANREWFSQKGIVVVVPSLQTVNICRDKADFHRFCKRMGFVQPATMCDNVVIKPRFGKGSKGVQFVDRSFVVQERIPFPEVSVDYFADMEGVMQSAVARYRLDVVDGESQSCELVHDFDYSEVVRMGQALKLVGHNVIQGYWTGKVFIFGEVNLRFGGGSHLTFDIFSGAAWLVNRYDNANLSEMQQEKKADMQVGEAKG